MIFTIEPTNHWRAGDRAYCIRGLKKDGRHIVEEGRVYAVVETRQRAGMMNDGLKLAGIDTGDAWGLQSGRFVCLRGKSLPLKQIQQRTRRGWLDAYRECRDARSKEKARLEHA